MYGLPSTNHGRVAVMTVSGAHVIMQNHIDCLLSVCPVKRQAKARLVEARVLMPADAPHVGS